MCHSLYFSCASLVLAAALLTSCGGGKGSTSAGGQSTSGTATELLAERVSLQEWPTITQLVGAPDEASAGTVFALDAQDRLILAAKKTGPGRPTLDAKTTAVALVSMALDISADWSPSQSEQFIGQAPSVSQLSGLIEQIVKAGGSPIEQEAVFELAASAAREAQARYKAAQAALSSKASVRAEVGFAPATLIDGPGVLNLDLLGRSADGTLNLRNQTPLAWEVVGPDGQARTILWGESTDVPDKGLFRFNLIVRQTADTLSLNQSRLIEVSLTTILKAVLGQAASQALASCGPAISAWARNEKLVSLFNRNSMDRFWKTFTTTFKDDVLKSGECSIKLLAKGADKAIAEDVKIIAGFSKLPALGDLAALTAQIGMFLDTLDTNESFLVCESADHQVVGCAASFELTLNSSTPSSSFIPFAVAPVKLVARTSSGTVTSLPPGLEVQGENASLALNLNAMTISAGLPGTAALSVRDPATGIASNILQLEVVIPAIRPASAQVQVGQTQNFTLSHPTADRFLIVSGSGLFWDIVGRGDGGAATGQTLLNAFVATGVSRGVVDIFARFGPASVQNLHPKAVLTVVEGPSPPPGSINFLEQKISSGVWPPPGSGAGALTVGVYSGGIFAASTPQHACSYVHRTSTNWMVMYTSDMPPDLLAALSPSSIIRNYGAEYILLTALPSGWTRTYPSDPDAGCTCSLQSSVDQRPVYNYNLDIYQCSIQSWIHRVSWDPLTRTMYTPKEMVFTVTGGLSPNASVRQNVAVYKLDQKIKPAQCYPGIGSDGTICEPDYYRYLLDEAGTTALYPK